MYRFILIVILISNFSHSQKKMKIPPYLKKGDTVAIVCTARKFFPEDAKPAIELLASWGLKAKLGRTYRDWETDRKSTRLNSSHRL